ncbi:MAG: flagellin, partial [Oscillibacter sp.]|nr:flagellin [Oscillibacter sp.]
MLKDATSSVGGLTLQIGDTSDKFNQMSVVIGDMHTTGMGIDGVDISNPESASAAIQTIKDAINYVSGIRGDLGAVQNRLEHTANNLSVMAENIQDAESTIRDTDVA